MGKHLLSHRYNFLPLLRSRPGGVQKELIVKDLPAANVAIQLILQKDGMQFFMNYLRLRDKCLIVRLIILNKIVLNKPNSIFVILYIVYYNCVKYAFIRFKTSA